jgi:hypothetical protein
MSREIETLREREEAAQAELRDAQDSVGRLRGELEAERAGGLAEQERLAERLEAAAARVQYLERRLVEVQEQTPRGA